MSTRVWLVLIIQYQFAIMVYYIVIALGFLAIAVKFRRQSDGCGHEYIHLHQYLLPGQIPTGIRSTDTVLALVQHRICKAKPLPSIKKHILVK